MTESKKGGTAQEWRLVPMVNLASLVVPVALMVGWLISTAPAALPGAVAPPSDRADALDLSVLITVRGFEITGDEGTLDAQGLDTRVFCTPSPCRTVDDYPISALQHRLDALKYARPEQVDITLVPHANAPFHLILETRLAATSIQRQGAEHELFPWVGISEFR